MHVIPSELLGDKQHLHGRALERKRKKSTFGQLAFLSARLFKGETAIIEPTPARPMLTGLSSSSIALAARLSPGELEEVRRGKSSLRKARATRAKKLPVNKSVSEIETLVDCFGVGPVKAAFAHLFTPRQSEVEIENFLCRCDPADVARVFIGRPRRSPQWRPNSTPWAAL